jgi:hypothetical protein
MKLISCLKFVLLAALSLCALNAFGQEHTVNELTKDGVGPIVVAPKFVVNGRDVQLIFSARNESGQPIASAKFCVQGENRQRGCDFELWTTAIWKPGEELSWAPLYGRARPGTTSPHVILTELRLPTVSTSRTTLLTPAEGASRDAASSSRFTIYLSAPTRDGFIDTNKDLQDSINDIRGRLSSNGIQVLGTPANADITLIVAQRGVGSEAYGQRTTYTENIFTGAELTSVPIFAHTFWVSSVMQVGSYRKEFLGSFVQQPRLSLGAWSACARQIADDIVAWVKANSTQLQQRRSTAVKQ